LGRSVRGGSGANAATARWVSASELADYAYCPRSWWYREHPPEGGPAPGAERRARAGVTYHQHVLGAERRRDAWSGVVVAAAILSALLLAWLVLGGGWFP
jgi:hypothetical protein